MSYGGGEFSTSERIDHTLKLSLGKIQTKLENSYVEEPTQIFRKDVSSIYSKEVPTFIGGIENYIVVDTMVGETASTPTPRIVVRQSGGSWIPMTVAWMFANRAQYTLSQIGNTTLVRDNNVAVGVGDLETITMNGQSVECFNKLSRNMFGRYVYWKKGMTGYGSANSNYVANSGDPYISYTGTDGYGTYRSDQTEAYNFTNNANEPYNGYLTLTGSPGSPSLNTERTHEIISTAVKAVQGGTASATQTNIYNFWQMLQTVYPGVSIVNPDLVSQTNVSGLYHVFLKCYLAMPTYTSWNQEVEASTNQDSIAFLNPIASQSFGEAHGYFNDASAYILTAYDVSSGVSIANRPVNSFDNSEMIYIPETGILIYYSNESFVTGDYLSATNPVFLSYIRYYGDKLSDGIIPQDTLANRPEANLSTARDLFIDTTTNTMYRLEAGTPNEWIAVGGSGGSGSGDSYWRTTSNVTPATQFDIVYGNSTSSSPGNVTINTQLRLNNGFIGQDYSTASITDAGLQSVSADSDLVVNGNMAVINATVTGNLDMLSDARLKTNVIPLENSLSGLSCIQPVSYDWKYKSSKKEIGFLAQNVQTVYPQLVNTVQSGKGDISPSIKIDKILTVNYIGFIPILTSAIQEQQKEIDELKAMVREMRKRLDG